MVSLLDGVVDFQVQFLDSQGSWRSDWPPDDEMAAIVPGERPDTSMPRAVRVTLEHERFGQIQRLFALPDFDPDGVVSIPVTTDPDDTGEDS